MANATEMDGQFSKTPILNPQKSKDGLCSETRRHKHCNNRIAYANTWAEDVQNYHTAKSVLPWKPQQNQVVKYVTRYDKSREEREYDVVLGRYRNGDKEIGQQQRESLERMHNLEKGRAKQLRTMQRFNVISNEPIVPETKDSTNKQLIAQPYRTKHESEYNIVTNISRDGVSVPSASDNAHTSSQPQREYNIVTNKYHAFHDVKVEQESAEAKRLAVQKYFQTRTFDPVQITLVDKDREKEFLLNRYAQQQKHGKDRNSLLPPREQSSEGHLYNILNQHVIDAERLATRDKHERRPLNRIKKTAVEERMRETGLSQQARDTDLCLNRFSHDRYVENSIHGFDVISNKPYAGRSAKPLVNPRSHTALTASQTIESGLSVSNRVAPSQRPLSNLQADQFDTGKANIRINDPALDSHQMSASHPLRPTPGAFVRTCGFEKE